MHLIQPLIGSQLFRFDEVSSTNDVLRSLIDKEKTTHGAVVSAQYQTSGRGQSGNSWESEAGKNLLLSMQIVPYNLTAAEQVYLNLFAGLTVFDFVDSFFPGKTKIKWPNDIYVDGKKIAGILIENSIHGNAIKSSVVGMGVNLNQTVFLNPKSTSFHILAGKMFNMEDMLDKIITLANKRYDELLQRLKNKLMEDYLNVLFLKGEKALFKSGEIVVEGEITGIDETGRLKLKVGDEIKSFSFKEISYI